MKLYQANYAGRGVVFVLAESFFAALEVAREQIDDEPIWLGLVASEAQNLLVQIGYVLRPSQVQ